MSNLRSLPVEILMHIAGFLPLQDVNSLLRVCRFFSSLLDAHLYDRAATHTSTGEEEGGLGGQMSALEWAAERGRISVIRKLLQIPRRARQFSTETKNRALSRAAEAAEPAVIPLLLDMGAGVSSRVVFPDSLDPSQAADGTALHHAARGGDLQTVRVLVDLGADVAARDHDGWSALDWAAREDREAVVRFLVEQGADGSGSQALHLAVECENESLVRFLLAEGADVDAPVGYSRHRPLDLALSQQSVSLIKVLVEHGADVNRTDTYGQTVFHHAVMEGQIEVCRLLLDLGADIHFPDTLGHRVLHMAVEPALFGEHTPELVRLLLARGADPFAEDDEGETALDHAESVPTPVVVGILREAMAGRADVSGRILTID